jgi:PAS domain S-box-containing protein
MDVLLVEDEPEMSAMLRAVLESRGHAVTAVADGESGWENYQRRHFPMVILDGISPKMDGLEVCRKIRGSPSGAGSLILVVTVRTSPGDLEQVLAAGADDYLAKPVDWPLLNIRLAIAEQRTRSLMHQQRVEAARGAAEATRAQAQAMLQLVLDTIPSRVFWKNQEGRYLGCNRLFAMDAGLQDPNQIVGKTDHDLCWAEQAPLYISHDRTVMQSMRAKVGYEMPKTTPDGELIYLEASKIPLTDGEGNLIGVLGTYQDVTERKEAERKIHRLNNFYAAISRANEAIVLIGDRDMLLHEICRIAVEYGQFRLAWIGLVDDETHTVKVAAFSGEGSEYLDNIHISIDAGKPEGGGPISMAIRDNREYVCNDFLSDPRTLPWQENARKHGLRASASCPLELEGQVVGALTLYAEETNYFDRELTNLLSDLSRDISLALNNFVREDRRKQVEEMLRRSEEHFRFLTENATDTVYRMSLPDGRNEYVSPASVKLFGYAPEEFYNSPLLMRDLIHPDWRAYFEVHWAKLVAREMPPSYEYPIIHKSGETRWMHQRNSPILDGGGTLIAIQGVATDITERKQAEEDMWRQKNFIRQVIDTDPNLISVKNAEGKLLLVNQAMADAYGKTPQELIGQNVAGLYQNETEAALYLEADREVLATRHPVVLITPNSLGGKVRWFLTIKTPMAQPDGSVNVLGIAVDITERKLAEERLGEAYKELEKLTTHLEAVREDEQKRIARELHDEMGGVLAALNVKVSLLAAQIPAEMTDIQAKVAGLEKLVDAGIQAMHRTVAELRPSLLDEVGLTFAIERYVQEFERNTEIECDLRLPEEDLALDGNQSTAIFRIIQESLTNVAKHAKASRASIVLSEWDTVVVLTIRDNGTGFDLNPQKAKSFGLLGIRERAAMVGGKAQITGVAGKGTTVRVSLPLLASRHEGGPAN